MSQIQYDVGVNLNVSYAEVVAENRDNLPLSVVLFYANVLNGHGKRFGNGQAHPVCRIIMFLRL